MWEGLTEVFLSQACNLSTNTDFSSDSSCTDFQWEEKAQKLLDMENHLASPN